MSDDMGSLYEDIQHECIELRATVRELEAERDALRALIQRFIDANPRYCASERLQFDIEAALAGSKP